MSLRTPSTRLNTHSLIDQPPRTCVAVANCISGPADFAPWIQTSFVDTFTTLDNSFGVRVFYLRRLTGARPHCLFVSITVWNRLQDFEAWRGSDAFTAAHPDRKQFRAEFSQMRSIRYDIEVDASVTLADLDSEVVKRLFEEHPALITPPVSFVGEIEWTPGDGDRSARAYRCGRPAVEVERERR
ncbi:antibiotic biosynthesis monooxygenase family protein [Nocardia suismassiliense]|uniref:hypothetical protein n=1 Tax=Nocardia suismassiliense TaxID=2077092 RepID=UPI00131F44FB|nr:hypothetical protein [Nocardia suismassiliense]